jgi:hypothetical protein
MVDDGNSTQTQAYKPVTHTWSKTSVFVPGACEFAFRLSNPVYRFSSSEFYADMVTQRWGGNFLPTLPTMLNIDSQVTLRAFENCLPSVGEGVSIVNFVLELKDLRRMFDGFFVRLARFKTVGGLDLRKRKWDPLSHVVGVFKRRRRENYRAYLKRVGSEFVDESAANFLNVSFGWQPFISDLVGIWQSLSHLERRLRWLKDNQGKLLTKHYRRKMVSLYGTLASDASASEGIFSHVTTKPPGFNAAHWSAANASYTRTERWVVPPLLHASMLYRYTMPDHSELHAKVAAYLDVLGVKLDARIVWNAIPFSFLIDWVFDVNALLAPLSKSNLGIHCEVLDFCVSLKSHAVRTLSVSVGSTTWTSPVSSTIIRQEDAGRYERWRPGLSLASVGLNQPTGRQILLGSALTVALTKNKRRRPRNAGGFVDSSG